MTVDYRTGDVLDQIRQLPDGSVDLVATSPPFLALRDYNGQPGQWGSADILGRDATGIDLDPANPALYPACWAQCWKALRADAGPPPITPAGQQLGLAI